MRPFARRRHTAAGAAALAAALAATLGCAAPDVPEPSDRVALAGVLRDTAGAPVRDAEAYVMLGSERITESVRTDGEGRYRLPGVPLAPVLNAIARDDEVTLALVSPLEDLPPYGTVEGDRVHLMPLGLDEFVDPDQFEPGATVAVRDAWVPLQARGHRITPQLVAEGGELSWDFPASPNAGPIKVTLLLEPGAVRLDGTETQDEITLTLLDPSRTPMRIPDDGYGALWTIQPRDIRFAPAARIRIEGERMAIIGLTPMKLGDRFTIFGASFDEGWHPYGEVELARLDGSRVTLESPEGIITKGAWGHVFSALGTDSGALVTCVDRDTGTPVACAVEDDNWQQYPDGEGTPDGLPWDGVWRQVGNVNLWQADYNGEHRSLYYTDVEPICSGCTNNGAPQSQLALGVFLCKNASAPDEEPCDPSKDAKYVQIKALRLCGEALGNTDLAFRDAYIKEHWDLPREGDWLTDYESVSPEVGIAYRNFSYQTIIRLPPCP